MKLIDLKKIIDATLEENMNNVAADLDVVISIKSKESRFGAIPHTHVTFASAGFDWESGMFIIHTQDDLIEVEK